MNTYTITLKRNDGTLVKSPITTTTQPNIYRAAQSAGQLSAAKYAELVEVELNGVVEVFTLLAQGRTVVHHFAK